MSDEPKPETSEDEFAAVEAARPGKSPILALAVIALAGVIGWHLRYDVAYAFASRQAVDLGDARSLRAGALDDNRYVTVAGQPERRYALFIEPRGERERQTLFRLYGAKPMIFVRAAGNLFRNDLSEVWTGRLRRFSSLKYAPSLRRYYAEETQVTRYLRLDRRLAEPLTDRRGEPLSIEPSTPLAIDVDYPGELKVYLSKDKLPSLADARHELEQLGLAPSPGQERKDEFVFEVPLPDAKKNEILGKLSERQIAFMPRQERLNATRATLRSDGDTLVVGAERVPWARVHAIGMVTPIVVGEDAFLLQEGESPRDYWWAPLLCALLCLFAAFNVYYLARALAR